MDQVKLFAVVEFSAKGGQEIAVVPFCWVRELQPNINICFWPTKNQSKDIGNIIKKCHPPNEKWN